MNGKNTLTLNMLEMQKAVEFYLNEKVFKEKVGVKNVKQQQEALNTFTVDFMPEDNFEQDLMNKETYHELSDTNNGRSGQ